MYITRDVYLPVYDDETGEERLFSTTDIDSEDDYLDESYFSDYDDADYYMQRMFAAEAAADVAAVDAATDTVKKKAKKKAKKAADGMLSKAWKYTKKHPWKVGLPTLAAAGALGGGAYYLKKKRDAKLNGIDPEEEE